MARLNVNGNPIEVDASPDTPLLWALRDHIGLTGTEDPAPALRQCGACTTHIDGQPVRSCGLPISGLTEAQRIVTIEGLSPDGNHRPGRLAGMVVRRVEQRRHRRGIRSRDGSMAGANANDLSAKRHGLRH